MGKEWDGGDIAFRPETWEECWRVLKPGGHLLSFSSARTYHRMAVAIEDAGFEIRDQVMWVYGSGFPKSHNISKAIDKRGGNNIYAAQFAAELKEAREATGESKSNAEARLFSYSGNWDWWEGRNYKGKACPTIPNFKDIKVLAQEFPQLSHWLDKLKPAEREIVGQHSTADAGGLGGKRLTTTNKDITVSSTDLAKEWDGWGTALKPSHEPICVARKPISETTIAGNVVRWGVGGYNIDASRVPSDEPIHYHSADGKTG